MCESTVNTLQNNKNDTNNNLFIKTIFTSCFSVLLLSACVSVPTSKPESIDHRADKDSVVVVGGGLSGLTAAYELEQKGYSVTLLEANNRLGGRVYTQTLANGQYAEAGGEFLDAPTIHSQMHYYTDLFNLPLIEVGYDDDNIDEGAYYLNGKLVHYDNLDTEINEKVAADYDICWEALDALAQQIPDAKNPQLAPHAAALDAMSALQWVDSLNLSPEAKTLALHHIRGEYGEPNNLSLLFLAQQKKAYENISDDEIEGHRIKGGNSELVKAFAKNITGDINLNNPVTNISQTDSGVILTTQSGSRYAADYAVVSVPATVLHKIDFTPSLPSNIQAATNLTYGHHNKVIMQFNDRFWVKRGLGGHVISDLPIGWVWEGTHQQDGKSGTLIAYTSGDTAEADKNLSDQQILAKRLQEIKQMYPESEGLLIDAKVQTWSKSPWHQSGFSAYSPNQVVPMWTAFHQPFGRIYFAGEHTDNLVPGYMEGAVRSGQRVAKQISRVNSN